MSRWFRMHDCILDDPKVQRLPGDLFKVWVNLLCVASRNEGALPELSDLAFALRMSEEAIADHLDSLISAGLIDTKDGEYQPHKWAERQYKADTSTGRVKRFRERSMKQDETVSETPPEADTDTEQKQTQSETRGPSEVSDLRKAIVDAFAAAGSINIPDTSRAGIWIERGWKPQICVAVISEILARKPSVSSLGYFEKAIADANVAPQGQARPPTNNYGPKPIVVSMTPEARAAAVAKVGKRWVEYDTPEWTRVAEIWKAERGTYPPHPQGGWYFPESYFAKEHAA